MAEALLRVMQIRTLLRIFHFCQPSSVQYVVASPGGYPIRCVGLVHLLARQLRVIIWTIFEVIDKSL